MKLCVEKIALSCFLLYISLKNTGQAHRKADLPRCPFLDSKGKLTVKRDYFDFISFSYFSTIFFIVTPIRPLLFALSFLSHFSVLLPVNILISSFAVSLSINVTKILSIYWATNSFEIMPVLASLMAASSLVFTSPMCLRYSSFVNSCSSSSARVLCACSISRSHVAGIDLNFAVVIAPVVTSSRSLFFFWSASSMMRFCSSICLVVSSSASIDLNISS